MADAYVSPVGRHDPTVRHFLEPPMLVRILPSVTCGVLAACVAFASAGAEEAPPNDPATPGTRATPDAPRAEQTPPEPGADKAGADKAEADKAEADRRLRAKGLR